MAEKEGFEPSMSYQPIHEFQSCAINRARRLLRTYARDKNLIPLRDFETLLSVLQFNDLIIIAGISELVKCFSEKNIFCDFAKNLHIFL